MATSKIKKIQVLGLLQDQAVVQKAVLLLTTQNSEESLNAESNFKLRSEAHQNGVVLKVVKNKLLQIAFQNLPTLHGQTYLAFLEDKDVSDEITIPKIVVGLVNDNFKKNFQIVGSIVNGEFLDSEKTVVLSKTPSLNDSMAMLAGTLNQIIARLAISVKEIPSGVARGVQEIQKLKA